ncbi:response regulator [Ovoidimarina sediminis]|uniref:response regulator n=1 Tax=Ovoidimarina sediminis TaxID=3079856 RepID=UPI00290A0EBF|nr:response regulator [Rhodophyticola sp. MJ-SS7]MDU8943009.1 response regulator [Rhodophyticola sp. MJ-SS7]
MPDLNEPFFFRQKPTPDRPLQGQTVLIVEDSRYASEALRLLCLKSGARVRRADSLASATRHLASYRPSVAIVDMGLPDGSGADLISEIAATDPPIPVILAISGDDTVQEEALAAGAQGLLVKPLSKLASFQEAILSRLPPDMRPPGPRAVSETEVAPDTLAFQDDLTLVAEALDRGPAQDELVYLAQFLGSVARTSGDARLDAAADELAQLASMKDPQGGIGRVSELVRDSLGVRAAI